MIAVTQDAACSAESHAAMKLARPAVLQYLGTTEDDDGVAVLVFLHCRKCESTLAIDPRVWTGSAGPRLRLVEEA